MLTKQELTDLWNYPKALFAHRVWEAIAESEIPDEEAIIALKSLIAAFEQRMRNND